MHSLEWKKHHAMTVTDEQMVCDYRLIDVKQLEGLLRLFAENAIVVGPFCKEEGGLPGKPAIQDFLQITIIANASAERVIEFIDEYHDGAKMEDKETNKITALVTVRGGATLQGKFRFKSVIEIEEFEDSRGSSIPIPSKRINELRIQIIK